MTTPEQPGLLGGVQPEPGTHDEGAGGDAAQRPDLTKGTRSAAVASDAIPDRGCLVTNHLNLMYMLASGLVLPRSGFGEKLLSGHARCLPGLDTVVHRPPRPSRRRPFHRRGRAPQAVPGGRLVAGVRRSGHGSRPGAA